MWKWRRNVKNVPIYHEKFYQFFFIPVLAGKDSTSRGREIDGETKKKEFSFAQSKKRRKSNFLSSLWLHCL
jgi:hypothetical protein